MFLFFDSVLEDVTVDIFESALNGCCILERLEKVMHYAIIHMKNHTTRDTADLQTKTSKHRDLAKLPLTTHIHCNQISNGQERKIEKEKERCR